MLDEGLEVVDGLWSGTMLDFAGEHYRLQGATMLPRPVQTPRVPIWVAGTWPHRRPFRRAARWDGVFADVHGVDWLAGEIMAPSELAQIVAYVREERKQAGIADAVYFDVVVGGRLPEDPAEAAGRLLPYVAAGLTWWVEGVLDAFGSPDELLQRVQRGPPVSPPVHSRWGR